MELSDEEKKAIETLESEGTENNFLEVRTLLNLVEKQQKEIEELKDINKKLKARKYMFNAITGEVKAIPIDNNYISKDKIREKIKELEQLKRTALNDRVVEMMHDKINILQLLLEEN